MKNDSALPVVTVYPAPMLSRLCISMKERDTKRVRITMLRWMQRAARRLHRFVNEPSLVLETEYDPLRRQMFLYTYANSVTDSAPEFLRRAKVAPGRIQFSFFPSDLHTEEEVNG